MRRVARRWVAPAFLTVVIYASLPVGPAVWRRFRLAAGGWEPHAATAVLIVAAGIALLILGRRVARLDARGALALTATAAGYVIALSWMPLTPAEKTHFLSYGALALLVRRALLRPGGITRQSTPDRYGWAELRGLVIVGLIGLGDEAVQYLLPRRHFEWKDVALNALSALLPLLAAWALANRRLLPTPDRGR